MIRAHIFDNFHSFGFSVAFVNECEGMPREVARFDGGSFAGWETVVSGEQVKPAVVLDDNMGRALLDALTRHYHGAEDSRALRRDYDDERKRVDRLAGILGSVVHALAARAPAVADPEPLAPGGVVRASHEAVMASRRLEFHGLAAGGGDCRGHLPGTLTAQCPDNPGSTL